MLTLSENVLASNYDAFVAAANKRIPPIKRPPHSAVLDLLWEAAQVGASSVTIIASEPSLQSGQCMQQGRLSSNVSAQY